MKDLIEEINSVARRVGSGTLPAGAARTVTLQRSYPAAIDDVWNAITEPDRIARWFLPVTGDFREGGTYQLDGNAGGEIRTCDPPRRLVVTWNPPGAPPSAEDASIVTVSLRSIGDGATTELDLEHVAVVPPEFWDEYGPGAVGVGWDLSLIGLGAHLDGIHLGTPDEMDRDPDVRAAMTASSDAWGVAYAATGTPPETVARVVAATTEFYVPPPDTDGGGSSNSS